MSLSGASEPVTIRIVGFILRVNECKPSDGEPSFQITLRSAIPSGWQLAKAVLDTSSVKSSRTFILCIYYLPLPPTILLTGSSVSLEGIRAFATPLCQILHMSTSRGFTWQNVTHFLTQQTALDVSTDDNHPGLGLTDLMKGDLVSLECIVKRNLEHDPSRTAASPNKKGKKKATPVRRTANFHASRIQLIERSPSSEKEKESSEKEKRDGTEGAQHSPTI